jgi:glycosidase
MITLGCCDSCFLKTAVLLSASVLFSVTAPALTPKTDPKAWQEQAVWYQIFPERFCNGDPANDPVRTDLNAVQFAPSSWRLRAWESDWYARDAWEQARGTGFYWDGVGERRYGGDLQGVIDKLDYIKELGATAIYLNPVFASRSHHKYDTDAFHHIEPTFGPNPAADLATIRSEKDDPASWAWTAGDKLFLKFVKEAHLRGLRVILDGVFNHCGTEFFAYRDVMLRGKESPYAGWFNVETWDDPKTPQNETQISGWHGIRQMPEFAEVWNGESGDLVPGVKKYLMDVTRRWMDPDGDGNPADGIDGWRLDVSWMVPNAFWREWNALVHRLNPSAYTVTEIWVDPTKVTLGGDFDATMNYEGFAMPVKGWLFDNSFPATKFAARLDRTRGEWPVFNAARLQNLIDSHDTPRASSAAFNSNPLATYKKPDEFDLAVGDSVSPQNNPAYRWQKPDGRAWKLLRMAAVLQMTYVGVPLIYYGTEAGMWGANDPDCRKPMVWPERNYDREFAGPQGQRVNPQEVGFDVSLHSFYRAAIAMRRAHPVLGTGDFRWLDVGDSTNTVAFLRSKAGEQILTVLNRSDEKRTISLPVLEGWNSETVEAFFTSDGSPAKMRKTGPHLSIEIPALTAAVFKP